MSIQSVSAIRETTISLKAPNSGGQDGAVRSEAAEQAAKKAMEVIEKLAENTRTNVQFFVDEETRSVVIRVQNADSGEIIREAPSEKVLESIKHLLKSAGLIFDRAA